MAHVTLIRPPSLAAKWVPGVITTPPIGLAYLAGTLAEAGHAVTIIDAVGEALNQRTVLNETFASYGLTIDEVVDRIPAATDLIGLSCMFTQEWPNLKDLIQASKKRFSNVPVVAGGEHVTAVPEFSLLDCPELDYCVLGEGEETLLELVEHLSSKDHKDIDGLAYVENGKVTVTGRRGRIRDIDSIPVPRWDLTPIGKYLDDELGFGVRRGRSMPLLATRGCPYQCTFCSSPLMWTTRWVARDPQQVIAEIESYMREYGATNFDFYDLTAIVKRTWVVEFCQLLIAKGLDITWQLPSGTRSEALDAEVCQLLYQSGCRNMTYAPESGSPAVLKRIKKKVSLDRMLQSMEDALRAGLNVKYNLIFGFPGETHREIWQSFKFILQTTTIGVHDLSIWLYSPYPGAELYDDLDREGRIATFDDEYFAALSAYSDFSNAVSWNTNMSARWLKFYRLVGTFLFYSFSYLTHPIRVFRTIRNIVTGQHESRAETVLAAALTRGRRSPDVPVVGRSMVAGALRSLNPD